MESSREGRACRCRLLREGGRGDPSPRDSGRGVGPGDRSLCGAPHSPRSRLREQWTHPLSDADPGSSAHGLPRPRFLGTRPSGAAPELSPRPPRPQQDEEGASSAQNPPGGHSEGSLKPCHAQSHGLAALVGNGTVGAASHAHACACRAACARGPGSGVAVRFWGALRTCNIQP